MFQYSNAFGYSSNPVTDEYLITFSQQYPELDSDGNIKGLASEPVARIMVNKQGLEALKLLLSEIKTDQ